MRGVQLLGALADGNRVLLLGDSILASTSPRYGNQMCETLVPLGWQVAVEAEPSRFVEFGNDVLDDVLPVDVAPVEDWNAAVVFLGSNYRGDPLAYEAQLREMLARVSPLARRCCSRSRSTGRSGARSTRSWCASPRSTTT